MIHAIIFDMDGVLIDSQPMHYLGDQQTLAAHSVEVPVEEMTAYAGTTNQLRFELFKERYHLDADVADMIREREATMIRLVREQTAFQSGMDHLDRCFIACLFLINLLAQRTDF